MSHWTRPGLIVAFAVGWACAVAPAYTCEADDDCTLSGVEGICTDAGHCAYPDSTCEGGWRYPVGAPGDLSETCVEDAPVGTTTGATTDGAEPTSSGDDDPSTSGAGSSTGPNVASTDSEGESDGVQTDTGDTGGCIPGTRVEFPAIADTFFSFGGQCDTGLCEELNYGAVPSAAIRQDENGGTVMAIRFGVDMMRRPTVFDSIDTIELELAPQGNEGSAVVHVQALDPRYPWVEGASLGEPAADGESNWLVYGEGDWPAGGPGAATIEEITLVELQWQDSVSIPLEVGPLLNALGSGADSLYVSTEDGGSLLPVGTRDADQAPLLVLTGCVVQ